MTRPFAIQPDPGPRRPSISHDHLQPNGTGISFFCQYYLRLHRRRHL